MFHKKLAPKVPNKIPKNPPLCSFVSFLIVLVIPFNKILESSRACTMFIMSFISLFEIIKVVVVEPCIFFRTPSSIAEAANVIPYGAKIFFANGAPTFIKGTAAFPNNKPKNPPD